MATKGDIISGTIVGLTALAAPLGLWLAEGPKKPPARVVVKSERTQSDETALAATTPDATITEDSSLLLPLPEASVVATLNDDLAFEPGQEQHGVVDREWFAGRSPALIAQAINEPLDADHEDDISPLVSEAMRAALAEVGLSSKIGQANAVTETSGDELALAQVEPEESMAEELSEEDRKIAAEFDKQVAASVSVVKPVVESKTTPEPKAADDAKRAKVTFIRPKGQTVHQLEQLLVKVGAKGIPIVLVRPREAGSPWYVQDTAPKQGTYVQAKGRFGNANTPEGAPFRLMVAFVPKLDDVPDSGAEIRKVPENWLLSQEVVVTLKRN